MLRQLLLTVIDHEVVALLGMAISMANAPGEGTSLGEETLLS